jgi:hypothetical protein
MLWTTHIYREFKKESVAMRQATGGLSIGFEIPQKTYICTDPHFSEKTLFKL